MLCDGAVDLTYFNIFILKPYLLVNILLYNKRQSTPSLILCSKILLTKPTDGFRNKAGCVSESKFQIPKPKTNYLQGTVVRHRLGQVKFFGDPFSERFMKVYETQEGPS